MPAEPELPAPGRVPRQWVALPAELTEPHAATNQAQLVALDTEFIRERTYFPELALLQCCIDQHRPAYLLDPTALNLTDFWSTLVNSRATVAVHAGSQDLELILQQAGKLPEHLFDTQIAAELLGIANQPSYRYLVEKLLGIKLCKEQNRSNWLARPLRAAQLDYAAADAFYLRELVWQLSAQLAQQNKQEWMQAEMQALRETISAPPKPERLWQKIRGNQTLKPRARGMLAILAALRDQIARERDLPRRWVYPDALLLNIAQKLGKQPPDAANYAKLLEPLKLTNTQQQQLLVTLKRVSQQPLSQLPTCSVPPALSQSEKELLKSWAQTIDEVAIEHSITPYRLANRTDLRVYLQSDGKKGRISRGWRQQLLAERLDCDVLNKHSFTPSSE